MKKSFIYKSLLLLGILLGLTSCDEEEQLEWDIYPVMVDLYVEDSKGNDLLNPNFSGNILQDGITLLYKGVEYNLNEKPNSPNEHPQRSSLRAYLPHFYGIQTEMDEKLNRHYVRVGEFDGADTYENETFVIFWNKEKTHKSTIRFSTHLKWKKNAPDKRISEFYLDGNKVETPIKVVLK